MPKLSIIVPIYKVEKYLHQCVDSILCQSFPDFEIILVDDGSPDGCPRICDEYALKDSRIKVVHKKNGGLSSARNAGLPLVSGEYVWFVDSDDYISENALNELSEYLSDNNDIVVFGFLCVQFNGKIAVSDAKHKGTLTKKDIDALAQTACSKHLYTYVWRNVYRRDFLAKNELSFIDGLSFAEDSAFNSKAYLVAEKITYADIHPYVYRDRTDGISKGIGRLFDGKIIEHFEVYDRIRDESYENNCLLHTETYYKDAGKFILSNIYFSCILNRIYNSASKNKYHFFKKVSKTEMIRKAFSRFDINEERSNSMDWWVLWAVKHRMYLLGHLICRYILYR